MSIRVLLVDPDDAIVEGFAESLESRGFEVLTASTERDCKRHLCESAPQVVVLEPDAIGSWGHRLLQSKQDDRSVPLVVVSRFGSSRVSPAKRIPWLTKPISTEELYEVVSQVVDNDQ